MRMRMRALTVIAVATGAAAEAGRQGHLLEHVHAQAMAPRDDCTQLPKLCTDAVLLRGYQTTLTYLCPETEGPSIVTVTTTRTTTVTADLTSSVPAVTTSDGQTPAVEEPTTTVLSTSTAKVTITRLVTKVGASPTSSLLPPPIITASFTAVLPSDVVPPRAPRKSSLTFYDVVSSPLSSVSAPTSSASSSFDLFPTHTLRNWSSIASTSSAAASPSVDIHRPVYWNNTAGDMHALGNLPTVNLARDAETTSTQTVTTTAATATESKKGQAGDTSASFVALFFGVLAATLLI